MKTRQIILSLMLISTICVVGCGKHEKKEVQGEEGATDGGDAGAGGAGGGGTAPQYQKGALDVGEKNAKLISMWNGLMANETKLPESLQTLNQRFKNEAKNEMLVRVNAQTDTTAKKMNMRLVEIALFDVAPDNKMQTLADADKKTVSAKVGEKDITLEWKADSKTFKSKDVDVIDLAQPTQALAVTTSKVDPIAELKTDLPSAILLKTQDAAITEITLDASKDTLVEGDVLFDTSYKGAEGDPAKPECIVYSEGGIGDTKPIFFHGVIDVADADHKLDVSKIKKEDVLKIAPGVMDAEIICIKAQLEKAPNYIVSTTTSGYKIKIVHPEAKKEEKKEEPKK